VSPRQLVRSTGAAADLRFRRQPLVPVVARTGIKDLRRFRAARRFRHAGEHPEWSGARLAFVWQYHDLFSAAGGPIARRHHCPLVSFVEAPRVWEDNQWGVRRPGWGGLLERVGEGPQLRQSDVVLCISDEVAAQVVRLGADERRIVISPTGVDAQQFNPSVSGDPVRRAFGFEDDFVVGWTGSFRRFHGLDLAIEAFAILHRARPRTRLMLVGDGPERERLQQLTTSLDVADAVTFTGAKPFDQMPQYVAAMDVAVVTVLPSDVIHYSPLKLREYLATERPVVAPNVGEMGRVLADGEQALLYEPSDARQLAELLVRVYDDPSLRARLAVAGRHHVLRTDTREVQLERLLDSVPYRDALRRYEQRTL
jgi:glycosyltransferase involved in cell wall biosynthesis